MDPGPPKPLRLGTDPTIAIRLGSQPVMIRVRYRDHAIFVREHDQHLRGSGLYLPVSEVEALRVRGTRALVRLDLPVPEYYVDDVAAGYVLIEDLGDETLAAYLERHPEGRAAIYTRAVTDLARAQRALQVEGRESDAAARHLLGHAEILELLQEQAHLLQAPVPLDDR